MIEKLGLGIDIVDVKRFEKLPYYKKIFLLKEIKYCLKYKDQARRFAGKFAVKVVKKLIPFNISFLDIETSHSNSKPVVKVKEKQKYVFLSSISHENEIAIVISERI